MPARRAPAGREEASLSTWQRGATLAILKV